jgi:L-glyceraldehyde 3-phosphate reductase
VRWSPVPTHPRRTDFFRSSRGPEIASALVGASSVAQLEANAEARESLKFANEELADIDQHATESGVNLWEASSKA